MKIIGKCPKCNYKKEFEINKDFQLSGFTYQCPQCLITVHIKPDDLNVDEIDK